MDREITKEYTNGDLTVIWKPKKCIHAGICVKMLPDVYKPNEKPWITPENATEDELRQQIDKCPSGALSYRTTGKAQEKKAAAADGELLEITVIDNGPLRITCDVKLKSASGETLEKKGPTTFCRCGASENKPFCDGSHRKIEFKG